MEFGPKVWHTCKLGQTNLYPFVQTWCFLAFQAIMMMEQPTLDENLIRDWIILIIAWILSEVAWKPTHEPTLNQHEQTCISLDQKAYALPWFGAWFVRTRLGFTFIPWIFMIKMLYVCENNCGNLIVCYYVALTTSYNSGYMTYNAINFWIVSPNSAYAPVIRSSERCSMLLLQWSFCFCANSLLRSLWGNTMLLLQRSLILCFWTWLWSLNLWRMESFRSCVT